MNRDIGRRYRHNPILTKAEIPYPVETVHNAAVVKHESEYIMLFRSHLRTGRSIIGLARSPDGFRFTADPQPRSEEHTSELQSQSNLVCRLLLEKQKNNTCIHT